MILRKATLEDIELLIQLRIDFLTDDAGEMTSEEITAIKCQLEKYFEESIPRNSFLAIIAQIDGKAVSTAYLSISHRPANKKIITGISGTLLNVYTYPEFRRKGIATKVIEKIIDEAGKIDVSSIELLATHDGKALYEKIGFGFSDHEYMRIKLI